MLESQASLRVDKILDFAAPACDAGKEASVESTPGGRLSSSFTPRVPQTPNRSEEEVCTSCIWSCCALISAGTADAKMVASAATETACTTNRVLFKSDEPRGK